MKRRHFLARTTTALGGIASNSSMFGAEEEKRPLFDLDVEADLPRVAPAVLAMAKDPSAAREKAVGALEVVKRRQRESMAIVKSSLLAKAP